MKHIKEFQLNENEAPVQGDDLLTAIRTAVIDQLKKSDLTDEVLTKEKAAQLIDDLSRKIYRYVVWAKPNPVVVESIEFKNSIDQAIIKFLFTKITS
jgi:hypothetical protein